MIWRSFSLFCLELTHRDKWNWLKKLKNGKPWNKHTREPWTREVREKKTNCAKLRRKRMDKRTNGWMEKKATMSMKLNNNFRNFYCDGVRLVWWWLTKMNTTKWALMNSYGCIGSALVRWIAFLIATWRYYNIFISNGLCEDKQDHLIRPNRYWKCTKSLSVQCIYTVWKRLH